MLHTFFITGVSTGLGRAFATAALEAGHTSSAPSATWIR
jgi:NAD(P)-dependent dehydrogenase (short-subunit alcohol dehydrogenase family)